MMETKLTALERDVLLIRLRLGLTLEETGRRVGLGTERVRQVQAKALRKVSAASAARRAMGRLGQ
jgi:DNA-directed RNA polymerase sigma subunit (sigma70/sigma32)